MLYRISVTERSLTGIAKIFRSRLSRSDDLLRAGTVHLTTTIQTWLWVLQRGPYQNGPKAHTLFSDLD